MRYLAPDQPGDNFGGKFHGRSGAAARDHIAVTYHAVALVRASGHFVFVGRVRGSTSAVRHSLGGEHERCGADGRHNGIPTVCFAYQAADRVARCEVSRTREPSWQHDGVYRAIRERRNFRVALDRNVVRSLDRALPDADGGHLYAGTAQNINDHDRFDFLESVSDRHDHVFHLLPFHLTCTHPDTSFRMFQAVEPSPPPEITPIRDKPGGHP